MKHFITLFLTLAIVGVSIISAQAKLLVSPLYISLEGRERTSQLVVANVSDRTLTYRLKWDQVIQDPTNNGKYKEQDPAVNGPYLQDFAVFSPRQVTLKPTESQTVRIGIRRPADLPEGEYKSHIKLEIIQNPDELQPVKGITAIVNMGYSLPVVYRVGEYNCQIEMGEPAITTNQKSGNLMLKLPVDRSGIHGVLGQIEVFYTPRNGERKLIMTYGNVNMFPEINERIYDIPLNAPGFKPGKIDLVFYKAEGKRDEYIVMDQKTIDINN